MEFMYPGKGRCFSSDAVLGVSKQYLYDLMVLFPLLEDELTRNSADMDSLRSALHLINPIIDKCG